MVVQSLLDPTKGLKVAALEGESLAAALGQLFGFAYVWALGGNLAPTCSEAFDEFAREHLQGVAKFPGQTAVLRSSKVNFLNEAQLWLGSFVLVGSLCVRKGVLASGVGTACCT
eukprot:GHRQ01033611.1.p3 GENE.GHRQ01033611.1~~GHRQ01033611.1.p3  ORF type:complete len:114 (-),score=24.54 GHRQ01033611.1:109-450(-)